MASYNQVTLHTVLTLFAVIISAELLKVHITVKHTGTQHEQTDQACEVASPSQFDLVPHQLTLADHQSSYHQHACMQLHITKTSAIQIKPQHLHGNSHV